MATKRVRFIFGPEMIQVPVIYRLGHEFEVMTNIRMADVEEHVGWVVLELDGALEAYETICAQGGTSVENADGSAQNMEARLYRLCAAVETVWVCDNNAGACGSTDGWPIMAGACDYIRIQLGTAFCRSGGGLGVFYANAAALRDKDLN